MPIALTPFPVDPSLTAVTIAYRNNRMIADEVMPRTPPLATQAFKYHRFDLGDSFRIPETGVGRTSRPNQIEFGMTETSGSTKDYGLDDPIPYDDIQQAPKGYDPRAHAVMSLSDLIALDREKRVAAKVFNTANYATGNKVTLSGSSQFSDPTSDPIGGIIDPLDAMVMRANIMVIGRPAWTKLIRHPAILQAMHGTSGDKGVANIGFLKELYELEDIFVGEGYVNTARKGQTAAMARVWGKHIALLYRDRMANSSSGRATWGFTAQYGTRVAGAIEDKDIGLKGGVRVRIGESVEEVVAAPDLGYLIENAVA
ncbi:MAG: phage capsid protein [Nitrospirae bacterium]|nr:phage capsid protein [Magnetococcales bacterium]HAT50751.1 phage capsid protein [Alphaproteobacteria bacterium]